MRNKLTLLWMLVCAAAPAWAQVSVRIGLPSIDIGINLRLYPELVPVPGYPVYYAPQMDSNYFFYDGMYWVFQGDDWYASSWYNGPWSLVEQDLVPVFVLRIPVRYYRQSPVYFRGWRPDAPPRWGERWGNDWQQRHQGWDKWNRSMPAARPPLPVYQRNYTGDRYPQLREQQTLQNKNYRYQPHDPLVRQQVQELRKHVTSMPTPIAPMPDQPRQQVRPQERNTGARDLRDNNPRDNPRDNQRDNPRDNQRASPPPPLQQQKTQPQREQVQEQDQRQQPARAQRPDNPPQRQAAPPEANRAQRPEHQQERDKPNERAKDRGNDKDDDRGSERRK